MATVSELAESVAVDTTGRFVCPMCDGGSSQERCLAISRYPSGYAYFCHRATCGFRGASTQVGVEIGMVGKPKPPPSAAQGEAILRTTHDPHATIRHGDDLEGPILNDLFWVSLPAASELGTYVNPQDRNEIIFVLRDASARPVGVHTRRKDEYGRKYCRTYKLHDQSPLHGYYRLFSREEFFNAVWVVEDPISAIRIAESGRRAIALMGTNFTHELARYAAEMYHPSQLIIALDRDATLKAFDIAYEVRQTEDIDAFPVMLREDIKNMDDLKFRALMNLYDPAP